MAVSTRLVVFVLGILIQGCFVFSEDNIKPDVDRIPEKIEHGEKGKSEYKVNSIILTGNQHTQVDNNDEDMRPPSWPPRPGRRSFISRIKSRSSGPTIMRPGRELNSEKSKRMSSPQFVLRPGRGIDQHLAGDERDDVPQHPNILRPGRDKIERPPSLFRPGREDVPQISLLRPGREIKTRLSVLRPGREDVPQISIFRPGREVEGPPPLFRPGREDVPQHISLFRPGREMVRRQVRLFRPGRELVADQGGASTVVRPGRRNIHYNMPWTYVGNTVDAHTHRKTHTFRQKAKKEDESFH
ncbi:uncharacterized protein LOC110250794 [Exaiptasia diaphana]|uniref:Uncharacterized protein n=1 Tax=Exaiptasia diaphana TaxID=2652724 RepID=A0A913Y1A4_EXADI|nr:uncharacterized protein LOC110250794 [Exaiptasia diaphana]KXJ23284.1 hypothetical protein AC249_AIPGENE6176 [Exaiptasia diaphana]